MSDKDTQLLTWKIVEPENPLEPPVQKLVAIRGEALETPLTVEEFREATEKVGTLITTVLENAKETHQNYCTERDAHGGDFAMLANALVRDAIREYVTRENVTVVLVNQRGTETFEPDDSIVEAAPSPKAKKSAKRVIAKPSKKNQRAAAKKDAVKAPPEPKVIYTPSPKLERGDFIRALMFRSMEDAILHSWHATHKGQMSARESVCLNTKVLWDAACEDETVPPLDARWKKVLLHELKSEGWVVVRKEGSITFVRPRLTHPVWTRKQDTEGIWYQNHGA